VRTTRPFQCPIRARDPPCVSIQPFLPEVRRQEPARAPPRPVPNHPESSLRFKPSSVTWLCRDNRGEEGSDALRQPTRQTREHRQSHKDLRAFDLFAGNRIRNCLGDARAVFQSDLRDNHGRCDSERSANDLADMFISRPPKVAGSCGANERCEEDPFGRGACVVGSGKTVLVKLRAIGRCQAAIRPDWKPCRTPARNWSRSALGAYWKSNACSSPPRGASWKSTLAVAILSPRPVQAAYKHLIDAKRESEKPRIDLPLAEDRVAFESSRRFPKLPASADGESGARTSDTQTSRKNPSIQSAKPSVTGRRITIVSSFTDS